MTKKLQIGFMRQILILCVLLLGQTSLAATKRALLIGVSVYQKHKQSQLNWNSIHGTNDVSLMSQTLRHQRFTVTVLENDQATAEGIRKALVNLAKQTKRGDLVYVHFSGHGQPVEDRNGDEPDGWDEAIVPFDAGKRYIAGAYEGDKHIIDDELNTYITNIRKKAGNKGFVYVVLDACHMGDASRGWQEDDDSVFIRGTNTGFSRSGKPFVPKRMDKRPVIRIPQVTGAANACYLEACRSYETNAEIKEKNHYYGPMSYYISNVLSNIWLTHDIAWIEKVMQKMEADNRLITQHMVVERSF